VTRATGPAGTAPGMIEFPMSWPTVVVRSRRAWRPLLVLLLATVTAVACGDDAPTPTAPTPPTVQPFALQCPADILGQSTSGAPVSIQVPAATTTGGVLPVTVSCSPAGAPFPIGSTRVTCGATDNVAPPPLGRTTFLAFGDSMTAGEVTVPVGTALGLDGFPNFRQIVVPAESYPTKLLTLMRTRYFTQASQFVVTNAGLPREWAVDGASRLPGVLISTNPQVLLLLAGANDIEAVPTSTGVSTGLNGLLTMVRTARQRGVAVFVGTLPPVRPGGRLSLPVALVQSFNDGIRAGAAREGAVIVDLHAAMAANVSTLIGIDGLHPTEAGYQRMAETFFTAIRTTYEGR
jgi:lysophospholipase L1-like esterase